MPAWITSLLRALVWLPISRSRSSTTTSRPARARPRATASPTTPAPTTTHPTRSIAALPLPRRLSAAVFITRQTAGAAARPTRASRVRRIKPAGPKGFPAPAIPV